MRFIHRKKRHHRRTGKSRINKRNFIERFVTSVLFKIIGVLILCFGVFYALNSLDIKFGIDDLMVRLFKAENDIQKPPISSDNFNVLLVFYFLPGILLLIFSSVIAKRNSLVSYIFSIIAIVSFLFIQIKVLAFDFYKGGDVYPSYFIAVIFLVFTTMGPITNAVLLKKQSILTLTCIYFYLCLILYVSMYGWHLNYLLPLLLLFTIGIAWTSVKINKYNINIVNFILAISFFSIFWLRKLLVNSKTEFLFPFLIYSSILFLLFYFIIFYSSSDKVNAMSKWMQMIIGFSNLIFYAGTTAFVMIKYFSFDYLWVFALALLLFNIVGLYLSGKYFPSVWKLPMHIITVILASLILPLLFNISTLLLFTAGLSVLLLLYSKYSKNQSSIIFSMFAMGIMSLDFFFHWIFKYLPALVFSNEIPSASLWGHGILSGVTMVATLFLSNLLLKDIEITLPKSTFNRIRYIRLIKGLTLFSVFLTAGWAFSALLASLSGSIQIIAPAWFISGSLFFILLIVSDSQKFSAFKKPILFLALGFTLSYPMLVSLNFSESLNNLIESGTLSVQSLILHYFALILILLLTMACLRRLYHFYPMNLSLRRGLQLYGVMMLLLILCTTYDELSILLRSSGFILKPSAALGKDILESNHRLPDSMILIASSLGILVWSLFKRQSFLRNFSILLFALAIVKIFLYDFTLLGQAIRTVLLFFIGILLLSFSFFYPRLKKVASGSRKKKRIQHSHTTIITDQAINKPDTV